MKPETLEEFIARDEEIERSEERRRRCRENNEELKQAEPAQDPETNSKEL